LIDTSLHTQKSDGWDMKEQEETNQTGERSIKEKKAKEAQQKYH
jgi:hypothetical protein